MLDCARVDGIASSPVLVWQQAQINTEQHARHHTTKICEVGNNTAPCGNQGSPQLGAPRSHRAEEEVETSQHPKTTSQQQSERKQWPCHVASGKARKRWNRSSVRQKEWKGNYRESTQSPLRFLSVVLFQSSSSWCLPSAPGGHQSQLVHRYRTVFLPRGARDCAECGPYSIFQVPLLSAFWKILLLYTAKAATGS